MRNYFFKGAALLGVALVFSSCASYKAVTLSNLSPTFVEGNQEDVVVVAKAFNVDDCKKYLDRNVLSVGYQPVQIYIQNDSDKALVFTTDRISLPCAPAREVAEKVHTSTAGRVVGYGVGALFVWPLLVPAVVDGVKSSQANESLDIDFASKVAGNQTIFPHSRLNKVLFVPIADYHPNFSLTLIEAESGKTRQIKVLAG